MNDVPSIERRGEGGTYSGTCGGSRRSQSALLECARHGQINLTVRSLLERESHSDPTRLPFADVAPLQTHLEERLDDRPLEGARRLSHALEGADKAGYDPHVDKP